MSAQPARLPPQIAFIIGNEACERFSFYGMRNLLSTFLAGSVFYAYLPEAERTLAAKDVFHTFVIGVYFFPLLGGWLADRWLGKYPTILWLSLVYTAGHALLAIFEGNKYGFYAGLGLIALGSGGIKPCVSAFVGDQFHQGNKHLAKFVFDAFYWTINFGSFFATLLAPVLLRSYGPSVAFGVPGVLMALATLVFWLGRNRYVRVPPARSSDQDGFFSVAWRVATGAPEGLVALVAGWTLAAMALLLVPWLGLVACLCLALVVGLGTLSVVTWWRLPTSQEPPEVVDGARAVLRLLVVFALVTPFWSLFDQKATTWVFQAGLMTKPTWFHPAQMQALNPALVMLLIPLNNLAIYPLLRRLGYEPTPLRRMTMGIALAGLSWVVVAGLQVWLDRGITVSIAWQVLPYLVLTLGEVLVSTTGLEFAYSQAPAQMKGTLMSLWNLAVTVGNLWVLLSNAIVRSPATEVALSGAPVSVTVVQMLAFAGFAFVAAALFGAYARTYPLRDHYRPVN
jgi:POT family proton-dependent oligopeptide transporter